MRTVLDSTVKYKCIFVTKTYRFVKQSYRCIWFLKAENAISNGQVCAESQVKYTGDRKYLNKVSDVILLALGINISRTTKMYVCNDFLLHQNSS